MSDRMEVELKNKSKFKILIRFFIIILVIKTVYVIFESGLNKDDLVMLCIYIVCATPASIFWGRYNSRYPNKIIIENNILIAERPFLKPIVMPLIEINSIYTNGFKSRGTTVYGTREHHVIKCGNKEVILDPAKFKSAGVHFDKFVAELKAMVANAKREASDSRDNGIN